MQGRVNGDHVVSDVYRFSIDLSQTFDVEVADGFNFDNLTAELPDASFLDVLRIPGSLTIIFRPGGLQRFGTFRLEVGRTLHLQPDQLTEQQKRMLIIRGLFGQGRIEEALSLYAKGPWDGTNPTTFH
jgi:hypothetical protein